MANMLATSKYKDYIQNTAIEQGRDHTRDSRSRLSARIRGAVRIDMFGVP